MKYTFNLNELRQDVADHLELDFTGLNPTQKFTLLCYVTNFVTYNLNTSVVG